MHILTENQESYESQMSSLREQLDKIDNQLIETLVALQNFVQNKVLGDAKIYSILQQEEFEKYNTIMTTMLRAIRFVPEDGLSTSHGDDLEGDSMLHQLRAVRTLLDKRFEVVQSAWELKREFDQGSTNEDGWNEIINNRAIQYIQKGGKNVTSVIQTVWDTIRWVFEQNIAAQGAIRSWMDENGVAEQRMTHCIGTYPHSHSTREYPHFNFFANSGEMPKGLETSVPPAPIAHQTQLQMMGEQ